MAEGIPGAQNSLNLNPDTFRKLCALLLARNISTTMGSLYVRRRSLRWGRVLLS